MMGIKWIFRPARLKREVVHASEDGHRLANRAAFVDELERSFGKKFVEPLRAALRTRDLVKIDKALAELGFGS